MHTKDTDYTIGPGRADPSEPPLPARPYLSNGTQASARLIADLLEALKEIAEGKGAYSRDPLEHCSNCVESMKAIAKEAIAKATGEAQ